MTSPLVSVVIPTSGRPQYLPEAVESAIAGMGHDIEVIVVPNGADESWKYSLAPYRNDARVREFPIATPNANTARNLGRAKARGKYIRFLDDDDLLYPEGAMQQYESLERTSADICSGAVEVVDDRGRILRILAQPGSDDFCSATLGSERRCLPVAHVYRASAIGDATWRDPTRVRQDVEWQLDLCAARDFHWIKTASPAGAWRQHWATRISQSTDFGEIRMDTVRMLLRTYHCLIADKRVNQLRARAVADGLWEQVHNCFFLAPPYWGTIAREALRIDPTSRPKTALARWPLARNLDPVVIEWLLIPKRWPQHQLRMFARRMKVRHSW